MVRYKVLRDEFLSTYVSMTRFESLGERLLTHRWFIHVSFWVFVLVFYSLVFSHKASGYLSTLVFVSLLMPMTVGSTYLLNYFLIPRYLMKGRYGFFALYLFYILLGALFLEMWVVVVTFILVAELDIKAMNPGAINIPFLITALWMVVFLGGAIKMVSHWRRSRDNAQRLMSEKIEAELRFLKTQLSPHFLFNTLNNLYYLASERSEKAPRAILALSGLLDYVLNETRSTFVPIEKELNVVRNYISLEHLRYEDRIKIDFEVKGNHALAVIAPTLLLTLVENAFKHGASKTSGQQWIRIMVTCNAEDVVIQVSNSSEGSDDLNKVGIGLTNFRNQLNLLYPHNHELKIERGPASYSVDLRLWGGGVTKQV